MKDIMQNVKQQELSFLHATSPAPYPQTYQILSKYFKAYGSYGKHKQYSKKKKKLNEGKLQMVECKSCYSCIQHKPWTWFIFFLYQNISKHMGVLVHTKTTPKTKWRRVNYKRKWALSFLHATRLVNLIYIPSKYHQKP